MLWRKKWTDKKIFVFLGASGSGKTEIAANFSLGLSREKDTVVSLIDLDIVKPYFRLRILKEALKGKRIDLVLPPAPLENLDLPILIPRIDALLRKPPNPVVIDLGGDDIGARVLGRYHEYLKDFDCEFLFVFNAMRPFMGGTDEIIGLLRDIEAAARLKITGVVHNSHLMMETTGETLKAGLEKLRGISERLGAPVRFHCIREDLYPPRSFEEDEPILPLKLFLVPDWVERSGD